MFNVKSPHDFVTFIEEDNNSLFNDEVIDAPAYSAGDMLTGRHNRMGNVGFGDGHVEAFYQTVFNQVPSAIAGTYVQHTEAMTSDITRKFFPDRGGFATAP
jgi:prepilin-type processing-associated H-X9-DG protein